MYLTGLSVQSITEELIERGKLNYDRVKVGSIFVGRVLNCKDYYNEVLYPKIIEKSVFDKCQQIKAGKKCLPKTFHKHVYYCSSIIRDYKTGQMMIGYAHNACYRNNELKVQISVNLIDSMVWTLAQHNKIIESKRDKSPLLKKLVDEIAILEDKIKTAEDKILKFNKQRDMIEIRLIKGKISEKAAECLEKEIEDDTERIKHVLESLTTELRLKNHEFSSFTNKDDNLFEELSDISDDLVKSNIIHEEIKMIKVERLGYSSVKLYVMYRFHEEWTVYDIDTKRKKLYLCGEEIEYNYHKRF